MKMNLLRTPLTTSVALLLGSALGQAPTVTTAQGKAVGKLVRNGTQKAFSGCRMLLRPWAICVGGLRVRRYPGPEYAMPRCLVPDANSGTSGTITSFRIQDHRKIACS